MELNGRHVAVIGLGESGLAMARWAAFKGARVTVLDDREQPPQRAALATTCPQARFVHGRFALDELGAPDLIAWSPGLSPLLGAAAPLHREATEAGIPIHGELDFFAAELAARAADGYRPRVVAITGTNGKTTVTQLAGHLAAEAGIDARTAGNIGPALLQALQDAVETDRLPQLWALELSSFQLALAGNGEAAPLRCTATVVLNVSQDHLDWHGTMAHYRDAKLRIHRDTACCIVNADDPATDPTSRAQDAAAVPSAPGGARGAKARATGGARAVAAPPRVMFGLAAPASAPGFGIVRDGGLDWLAEAVADDEPAGRRRSQPADIHVKRLMPADALRLHGAHNQANVLAALALLRAAGVPLAAMLRGLRDFEAGPHRCSLVAVINDIAWYDDSKGTNVGATVAALSGLGKRCVLIAGGIGKGQDFAPLAPAVRRHARAVVLIGRDAGLIEQALAGTGVPVHNAGSMEEAVNEAARLAASGDAVLMSPACASFDMFRNYPHRSEVFVAAVTALAQEAGQPC